MRIPMLFLPEQYSKMKQEIDAAMQTVLISGSYINGPQVSQFEQHMEEVMGVNHAIGVASGSDALLLSLHALGIGTGDKVIVPTFTFFATAGAVNRLGATPVFVDIDPDSYNLDLKQVEFLCHEDKAISAIIPVHLFGLPCNMDYLMTLAEKFDLKVIEDACQSINADIQFRGVSRKAGTIGQTGCFSFFPSKNLGCYGDGGMIVTNDDTLTERIRTLRVHGSNPKYYHRVIGYNSRLDTIQAAVLDVKLKHLDEWTQKRREVATQYNETFQTAGLAEHRSIKIPEVVPGHVFHQFVIEVDQRDRLAVYLQKKGIGTSVYYPLPLHLQECFQELNYGIGDLPVAEKACQRVLALPIDPELTLAQIQYIVQTIEEFVLTCEP